MTARLYFLPQPQTCPSLSFLALENSSVSLPDASVLSKPPFCLFCSSVERLYLGLRCSDRVVISFSWCLCGSAASCFGHCNVPV